MNDDLNRICEHGGMARKCPHCELREADQRVVELEARVAELESALAAGMGEPVAWRAKNSLAPGGWNYYDADTFRSKDKEPLYAAPPADQGRDGCTWTPDSDPDFSMWETACGNAWEFTTEGPKENGVKFCPYCGKPLVIAEAAPIPPDAGDGL